VSGVSLRVRTPAPDLAPIPLPCSLFPGQWYLKNPEFAKTLADRTDQLTTEQVKVQKVRFVCLPVDAGGEPPPDSAGHLTCYQVKAAKLSPKPHVEVTTQFQTSRFELKKPQLLCTPSTLAILP